MPALCRCCRTVCLGRTAHRTWPVARWRARLRPGGALRRTAGFSWRRPCPSSDAAASAAVSRHRMDRRRWLARRCALAAPCSRAALGSSRISSPAARTPAAPRRRPLPSSSRAAEGASRGGRGIRRQDGELPAILPPPMIRPAQSSSSRDIAGRSSALVRHALDSRPNAFVASCSVLRTRCIRPA